MIPDCKREFPLGTNEPTVFMRAVVLSLILGVVGIATPIKLNVDNGSVSLSSSVAIAAGGKGGGGGQGGGRGQGGGGGGGQGGGSDKDKDKDNGGSNNGNSGASTAGGDGGGGSIPLVTNDQRVALAQFTTVISKRYPANRVNSLDNPHQAVSFFTEVVDMQGHTITHRWTYNGVVEYQSSFRVSGPKWRIWSTQILPADKPGTWKVEVVDERNKVLQTSRLNYQPIG